MPVIRLQVLEMLKRHVEAEVPRLAGKVVRGRAPRTKALAYPSLAIYPVRWKYIADQSTEVEQVGHDKAIHNVGRHEALVQLRLSDKTQDDRYELEQLLVDLFQQDEERPGVLMTDLATDALGEFRAVWELDEDEWEDEAAFDEHHQSIIALTCTIPALVTRRGLYTVHQVRLGVAHDFEGTPTPASFATDAFEVTVITEDS